MPRPRISEIHDCAQLREACSHIGEVPAEERREVKHELMRKSVELDCPESIPDDWRVKIGTEYE